MARALALARARVALVFAVFQAEPAHPVAGVVLLVAEALPDFATGLLLQLLERLALLLLLALWVTLGWRLVGSFLGGRVSPNAQYACDFVDVAFVAVAIVMTIFDQMIAIAANETRERSLDAFVHHHGVMTPRFYAGVL